MDFPTRKSPPAVVARQYGALAPVLHSLCEAEKRLSHGSLVADGATKVVPCIYRAKASFSNKPDDPGNA